MVIFGVDKILVWESVTISQNLKQHESSPVIQKLTQSMYQICFWWKLQNEFIATSFWKEK